MSTARVPPAADATPCLRERAQRFLRRRAWHEVVLEAARRAWHAGAIVLQRDVLRRQVVRKQLGGYALLLDVNDPGLSRQLLYRGEREAEQRFLLERVVRPGWTVLDIGANVGYYTVMLARLVGAAGHVHAVEPAPRNFESLQANVALNGLCDRVSLERVAIAAADGRARLWLSERPNWHSLHFPHVDATRYRSYARPVIGSVDVETRALETLLSRIPPLDLLRMDLEGFEVEILNALAQLPQRTVRNVHVLFETHPEFYDAGRNDLRPVLKALCFERGFRIEYLVSDFHFELPHAPRGADSGRTLFERRGYGERHIVKQFRNRAVYRGIDTADAIELAGTSECVHAALLAPGVG